MQNTSGERTSAELKKLDSLKKQLAQRRAKSTITSNHKKKIFELACDDLGLPKDGIKDELYEHLAEWVRFRLPYAHGMQLLTALSDGE